MEFDQADIARIEQHYVEVWLTLGSLVPSSGLEAIQFDTGLALYWPQVPTPLFNRVIGIGRSGKVELTGLDLLIGQYVANGIPWSIQLTPGVRDVTIRDGLRDRNLSPQSSSPILALKPDGWIKTDLRPDISIEDVKTDDESDFARILVESFEMPDNIKGWIVEGSHADGVTNYLGRFQGVPAATGMTFDAAGVAGLYSGGVLNAFRRRGLHSALIGKRIESAFERGTDLLMSEVEVADNQSFRDLEKHGFKTAYVQENWTPE